MSNVYFTKLFTSITQSTVWCEPHTTRIVWITMLAMADKKGRVWAAIPGLANTARVTIEECEQALARFMAPDKYSRTPDNDGRRIEPIDGGWQLLNYTKYREMRDADERAAQNRAAQEAYRSKQNSLRKPEVSQGKPPSAQRERETEAEDKNKKDIVGLKPSIPSPTGNAAFKSAAVEILAFLNEKTGRSYEPVPANLELIVARLKDGATADDLRAVVAKKCREWRGDEKMDTYLRPKTLFSRTNYAQYRGEIGNAQAVS